MRGAAGVRQIGMFLTACVCAWPLSVAAQHAEREAPPAGFSAQAEPKELPATVRDGFTFAATGDLLGPWRPRMALGDPGLEQVSKLLRGSDAAFANMESSIFDETSFKGYPAAENGGFDQMNVGGGPLMAAAVARDLREMGIRIVSRANNHAVDWSVEGMFDTTRNLDAAGIVHAGVGRTRFEARAPAILETPHGRVALISTASTFLPMAVAGPGDGKDRAPRPGLSALRNKPVTLVTKDEFTTLRGIAERQGLGVPADAKEVVINPNHQTLNDQVFRLADKPGLTYDINKADRKELLDAIRDGKRKADFAVFSIHAHETASGGQEHLIAADKLQSADFLQPLFHDAIDAGADAVVTHGPHVLRGIEIYKGKPIFYSLGSLFLELDFGFPREWYDSMVAVTEFKGGKPSEIRLYPLNLGSPGNEPRSRTQQGVPRPASPADAKRVLEQLQRDSAQYGTQIRIENNVGVIKLGA